MCILSWLPLLFFFLSRLFFLLFFFLHLHNRLRIILQFGQSFIFPGGSREGRRWKTLGMRGCIWMGNLKCTTWVTISEKHFARLATLNFSSVVLAVQVKSQNQKWYRFQRPPVIKLPYVLLTTTNNNKHLYLYHTIQQREEKKKGQHHICKSRCRKQFRATCLATRSLTVHFHQNVRRIL